VEAALQLYCEVYRAQLEQESHLRHEQRVRTHHSACGSCACVSSEGEVADRRRGFYTHRRKGGLRRRHRRQRRLRRRRRRRRRRGRRRVPRLVCEREGDVAVLLGAVFCCKAHPTRKLTGGDGWRKQARKESASKLPSKGGALMRSVSALNRTVQGSAKAAAARERSEKESKGDKLPRSVHERAAPAPRADGKGTARAVTKTGLVKRVDRERSQASLQEESSACVDPEAARAEQERAEEEAVADQGTRRIQVVRTRMHPPRKDSLAVRTGR
jgi:hypothetical protein